MGDANSTRGALSGDRAPAEDEVAVHEARRLPRRNPVGGLGQRDRQLLVAPGPVQLALEAALDRPGAVAEPYPVDAAPLAVQPRIAHAHSGRGELLARPDDDAVRLRLGGQHVERLRRADSDPAALANGEVVVSLVFAEHAAARVDHVAHARPEPAVAPEEAALALAREEAQILALRLARDGKPGVRRQPPHLRLA